MNDEWWINKGSNDSAAIIMSLLYEFVSLARDFIPVFNFVPLWIWVWHLWPSGQEKKSQSENSQSEWTQPINLERQGWDGLLTRDMLVG